ICAQGYATQATRGLQIRFCYPNQSNGELRHPASYLTIHGPVVRGFVTAPRVAFWNPNGTWDVENHGVAPDVEVEYDPKLVREGHDPQLERAVQVVMDAMKKTPPSPRHPLRFPTITTTSTPSRPEVHR